MSSNTSLSHAELHMLQQILGDVVKEQSNAGCNQLTMDATKENIAFMHEFNKSTREEFRLDHHDDHIHGFDLAVTLYLRKRIQQMINSSSL